MKIFLFIIAIFLFIIFLKCLEMKLIVDWRTFFKRGFAKSDNSYGIICYTGKQGYGKTYSCIKRIIEVMNSSEEFLLITNVTSFKVFIERTIFIENLYDMIDYVNSLYEGDDPRRCIIFFDEIFSVVNKNYAVDDDFLTFISQLRKRKIILFTTAQEWTEINITFRRYVRFQVSCRMFALPLTRTAVLFNYINDGENLKLNPQTMEYEAPVINTKIMKGNKSVIDSYDTYQVIKVGRKTNKKNKYSNYIGDVKKMS